MKLLQDIQNAKHVVIEFDDGYIACASTLYTYALTLHKKVSLLCNNKDIDSRFSFLPWFTKIKTSGYSSADLHIKLKVTALDLYKLLEENNIVLNKKMATALYAGVLLETEGFTNANTNGMVFAMAKRLIDFKAEYKICTDYILKRKPLSYMRLKSVLFKKMILKNGATLISVPLSEDDLKATGSKLEDAYEILKETLFLPYVEEAILVDFDNSEKILKRINKEV